MVLLKSQLPLLSKITVGEKITAGVSLAWKNQRVVARLQVDQTISNPAADRNFHLSLVVTGRTPWLERHSCCYPSWVVLPR